MTVLDQVLEAEKVNRTSIEAAKETAARAMAVAETAKNTALTEAKTTAANSIDAARTVAEKAAQTEAVSIIAEAEKEAATVKAAIDGKATDLTKSVVDAFKNS